MDLLLFRRYRAGGGTEAFRSWDFSTTATDFGDDAPARRVSASGSPTPSASSCSTSRTSRPRTTSSTGSPASGGEVRRVAAVVLPLPPLAVGVATGVTAWGTSYAVARPAGIYQPITAYDGPTLWKDLSAHLVFGATVGAVLTLTGGRARRR